MQIDEWNVVLREITRDSSYAQFASLLLHFVCSSKYYFRPPKTCFSVAFETPFNGLRVTSDPIRTVHSLAAKSTLTTSASAPPSIFTSTLSFGFGTYSDAAPAVVFFERNLASSVHVKSSGKVSLTISSTSSSVAAVSTPRFCSSIDCAD